MFKFIVQLIVVLIVALFLTITLVSQISNYLTSYVFSEGLLGYSFSGTLKLAKDELAALPIEQREAYLQTHRERLGYEITLKSLDDFAPKLQRELMTGQPFFNDVNDMVAVKLPDEKRVVVIDSQKTPVHLRQPDDTERIIMSDFYFVQQRFNDLPETQWQSYLNMLNQAHNGQLSVVDEADLPKDLQTVTLRDGRVILKTPASEGLIDDISDYYFQKITATPQKYLRIGPIEETVRSYILKAISFFVTISAFMLIVPFLLWLTPTWLTLRRLMRTTKQFSQGNLDARAKPVLGSHLRPLARRFNDMAESIQRLFNSHKMMTMAVSHDLRTPLSRLEFAMEMLRKSPDNQDVQLNRMQSAVDELSSLVSEILSVVA